MASMQLPTGVSQVRASAYCSVPHCFCRLFLHKMRPPNGRWKRYKCLLLVPRQSMHISWSLLMSTHALLPFTIKHRGQALCCGQKGAASGFSSGSSFACHTCRKTAKSAGCTPIVKHPMDLAGHQMFIASEKQRFRPICRCSTVRGKGQPQGEQRNGGAVGRAAADSGPCNADSAGLPQPADRLLTDPGALLAGRLPHAAGMAPAHPKTHPQPRSAMRTMTHQSPPSASAIGLQQERICVPPMLTSRFSLSHSEAVSALL